MSDDTDNQSTMTDDDAGNREIYFDVMDDEHKTMLSEVRSMLSEIESQDSMQNSVGISSDSMQGSSLDDDADGKGDLASLVDAIFDVVSFAAAFAAFVLAVLLILAVLILAITGYWR